MKVLDFMWCKIVSCLSETALDVDTIGGLQTAPHSWDLLPHIVLHQKLLFHQILEGLSRLFSELKIESRICLQQRRCLSHY